MGTLPHGQEVRHSKTAMKEKEFYPDYLTEIVIVIMLCIEVLLLLVWAYPPQIGREIDFIRQYQPRPEWYFLWVFELLRYFPGNWTILGAIVIPFGTAFLIIFFPLLDKKIGRKVTTAIAVILFIMFSALTISGLR